ncbi:MAG: hypothetical protein JSS62_06565 [Verrucomicrobia bacterium]|nr:hypothetical protein [Verrucomicrobiota bacterium]
MLASSVVAITATAIAIIFLTKGYSQHLTGLVSSSSVGVVALAVLAVASIKSRQNPSSTLLTSSTSNSPHESTVSPSPAASSSHSRTEEGASANITADPPAHSSSDSQPPAGSNSSQRHSRDDLDASDNDEDLFETPPSSPRINTNPSATFAPIQPEHSAGSEASLPLPSGGNSQPIPVTSTSNSPPPPPPAASVPLQLANTFGNTENIETMTLEDCKTRIITQVSQFLILLGSKKIATHFSLPELEKSICEQTSALFNPMIATSLTPAALLSYVRIGQTPPFKNIIDDSILALPNAVDDKDKHFIGGNGFFGGAVRSTVCILLRGALFINPSVQTMLNALNSDHIPENLLPKGPARLFTAHLFVKIRDASSTLYLFLQPCFDAYIKEFEACYQANKTFDSNKNKDALDNNRRLLIEKLARIVVKHLDILIQACNTTTTSS